MSRLAAATETKIIPAGSPLSNFDFVEKNFSGSFPIRRLFSQARSRNYQTLVVESVPAEGAVENENQELTGLFSGYHMEALVRLSFWKSCFHTDVELGNRVSDDCIGFALLKRDRCPAGPVGKPVDAWHVFESIIAPYPHPHNFIPCARPLTFRVGERSFDASGVLYCQQNGLNKCCAHVALRSLCCAYLDNPDLTFGEINGAAFPSGTARPWDGLKPDQIETVLRKFGVSFYSIWYPGYPGVKKMRSRLPYQRLLYSGVETGSGALLAFSMSGPQSAGRAGHIVPIFGHTFNEDTWAPNAAAAYFKIGQRIRYVPSEAWMSSFIGHDDNFGSNLCIPHAFVERRQASYVVSLRPREFAYPPFSAEAWSAKMFYSLLPQVMSAPHVWMRRLRSYVENQKLILRTVPANREDYADHLLEMSDWEGNRETRTDIADAIENHFPPRLWIVEVSIPDLFSTNLRKLGELVLRADVPMPKTDHYQLFVMARLPGVYAFFDRLDGRGHPRFSLIDSPITGHSELLRKRP